MPEMQPYSLSIHSSHYLLHGAESFLKSYTASQLVKKFPSFYETRRFITAVTIACHLSLSWASSSFSICTSKSLVLDMLRSILSLHVTGTTIITFTVSQHCFRPKSYVPGPINCCGWGRELLCNVIFVKSSSSNKSIMTPPTTDPMMSHGHVTNPLIPVSRPMTIPTPNYYANYPLNMQII